MSLDMKQNSKGARAVTFEEFSRRGGGGGRGPEEDGLLSRMWKRWAVSLVGKKLEELEGLPQLTPAQFVTLSRLKSDFDRVSESPSAAYRAVREHSRVLNHPLIKPFFA